MNPYHLFLLISGLIFISYLFNAASRNFRIPSVILLLSLGVILNACAQYIGFELQNEEFLLKIFGTLGLILIVLEGSLDIIITRNTAGLLKDAFIAALLILFATASIITIVFVALLDLPLRNAIVYAIPLSIISSAIAIPSVTHLQERKRNFVIYESTFSDIIGILAFNYAIDTNATISALPGQLLFDMVLITVIVLISIAALFVVMNYSNTKLKLVPILAVLIGMYSLTQLLHLPALLLILTFGLVLNNLQSFQKVTQYFLDLEKLAMVGNELKTFSTEIAFLIRTFFFILFGYTLDLNLLFYGKVVIIGALLLGIILCVRYVFLKFVLQSDIYPELFIAPRGLVTLILFFSIPPELYTNDFSNGIVYAVVIASSIMMMVGLLCWKEQYIEEPKLFLGN